ncbi:IS1595 family transposase [Salinisphaera hydrothermalis]|uniref:IS1595 family transposase n=1 Tax=Salinisphaera hydrothermalis TaxID=563188 RepID=UPI00333EF6FD
MAINRVQMQPGLSMREFMQRYGAEVQCEAALASARWPSGFRCPACHGRRHTTFERVGRTHWQCQRCRHQTTVTSGTIFASTKLPLTTWFLAMHLMTQAKNNVSALELRRQLGVSYRAAWRIKQKLLQVMVERESRRQLSGRVEIDDAYLGGERPGKRGRGSANKIPFVIAVSTTAERKPHQVAIRCAPFTSAAIADWANEALAAETQAVSDGLPAFRALRAEIASHLAIVTGSGRPSATHPEFRWVNIMLGNLKNAITGTYHAFKFAKYASRYLADFQYRFNRRYDLSAILPRLLRAAAMTTPWTEDRLRMAEARA